MVGGRTVEGVGIDEAVTRRVVVGLGGTVTRRVVVGLEGTVTRRVLVMMLLGLVTKVTGPSPQVPE